MLPREKSVLGILTFSYLLAVATSLPYLSPLPLALATLAYLLHLFTFDPVFYAKTPRQFYALTSLNFLPYIAAAALGWWNPITYAVGLLFFVSYATLMHRGRGRSVEGVVTGTALLSSTFLLVKAVVTHQLGPKDYLLYLLFVGYHVATAYYVESRLAFRNVKPHMALYVWAPVAVFAALLWPSTLLASAEPLYKFLKNVKSNVKYSRYEDITKMGWKELARSAFFTALLAVVYNIL
ncbi:MAG: hypothetical protein QW086_00235 [Pyrobaculum sp.]